MPFRPCGHATLKSGVFFQDTQKVSRFDQLNSVKKGGMMNEIEELLPVLLMMAGVVTLGVFVFLYVVFSDHGSDV